MHVPFSGTLWDGRRTAGLVALLLIAVVLFAPFAILPLATSTLPSLAAVLDDSYILGVLRFTLMQAALSAILSVVLALPLALALHRNRFAGRQLLLRLFLLPQALPTLVAALGIVEVWGRAGVVSDLLVSAGLGRLNIYGLTGILLAHVFFNMPLAARLMLAALSTVPAENWKLAGQLSFGRVATFRIVEWPAIRPALAGIASLIFMLCVTSFALVLVLGGGPGATTLEVAIYQSLRYDFDPGRVISLAVLQIVVVSLILVPMLMRKADGAAMFSLGSPALRYDKSPLLWRCADAAIIAMGATFVIAPFFFILSSGLQANLTGLIMQADVQRAILTSLKIAVLATGLGIVVSLALVMGRQAGAGGRAAFLFDYIGSIVLVVPPIVVGAGWFLVLRQATDVYRVAPAVIVVSNAIIAIPFMIRILGPALATAHQRYGKLAGHLALGSFARWRLVEWPALRLPLGLAAAFGLALSLGDLGVVALFGNQDLVTLPYLLLQRMGSYRSTDAAGLALMLAAICMFLMWLAELGTRTRGTVD
ncbi:ABC transporter permease subunit [Aureimonas fodinaquatilis]|uniref:ABC transporter permease subunit n=2 Tax=Aureimonas fodinaquatilis TaxID=2565783 RepID=A0A5B0DRH8_9HYPH|nr:ABC transporter permease subunit [Aureimonas fodinaquatilis]